MLSFRSIIKIIFIGAIAATLVHCASTPDPYDEIIHGTIDYPFASRTAPLGHNDTGEKFVIRSAVGNTEYTVEIPGAARDYDVQVPLAAFEPEGGAGLGSGKPSQLANPVQTDREMVAALPSLEKNRPTDTGVFDSAFGVGPSGGPNQSPSYSLGIAKINNLYKQRQYSYSLIEINNMLAFYPNSPKLLKMKGTVLIKLRNYPLAELAWIKALELSPTDKTLRKGVSRLQHRIKAQHATAQNQTLESPYQIPKPIGGARPTQQPPSGVVAH